ncbi:MAG: hypothetical protein ABI552_00005, partial [Casimicrobiaceae bacterium]
MTGRAIIGVHARRVWDSRGRPTIEAEVTLAGGALGRAIAPAGASRGTREAVELRDGGARFGGLDVTQAIATVNGPITRALRGRDASDQANIDATLITLDGTAAKSRLGGNAMVAVSLAVAHAAAAAAGLPLWRYLAQDADASLPLPQIQIFGGGAHAGLRPGHDAAIALDIAASEFGRDGRYTLALDGRVFERDDYTALLLGWAQRYPVLSIEDPFAEDDRAGWIAFAHAAPAQLQIVGDDYL